MARNRRNQSGAFWLIPALKAGILCTMLGGSAVGFVMQKKELHDLGRSITRREKVLERLKWENSLRAKNLASLQSSKSIIERVRGQKLPLSNPGPGQTIWLAEPARDERSVTPMVGASYTATSVKTP